ncbi:TPA: hypothetical protein ACF2DD_002003 [Clostridium perfringens]
MRSDRELTVNIDWRKFKINTNSLRAKNAYIEFCEMLDETDFELDGNYVGNKEKVWLVYKFNKDIRLNIRPDGYKRQTYKTIINLKNNLVKNSDKFIKFVGLSDNETLIAQIKTFDGGETNIDINQYNPFHKSRQDFYNKLKEVNGCTTDYYKNNDSKINIYIDDVKINSLSPRAFKSQTYKAIINFKEQLLYNGDKFVKFIRLSGRKLIAQIKTLDGGKVNVDMTSYNSWSMGRQSVYDYCKEKGYKILSPYTNARDKILIDFNCGHNPHWIAPMCLKRDYNCPICNISKGEKAIRLYLENSNIDFVQEYRFEGCKYKYTLPFDFYIEEYNLCIEFDGEQHYKALKHFGGDKKLKITQKRDKVKNKYCKDNNINLLRIPYYELDEIENILDEELDRLRKLNKIA